VADVALVLGTLVGVLALAVGPLLLPWPWRVRWILAAEAVNPLIAVTNASHEVLVEQVLVVGVGRDRATLKIVVERADAGAGRVELVGPPCSVGELAALEGWCCARTPLVLVGEADGASTLQGPHRAITGLREADHDLAVHRS